MDANGARYTHGDPEPRTARPAPRFIETPEPAPVHDLLVMSHGPDARPDDRANHACLNSLASISRIISAGA
jgi:hypothetical protein